jgi:arylsulfatase
VLRHLAERPAILVGTEELLEAVWPGTFVSDGVLKVDGKEVASQKMEHTIPFILEWDENLDVGSDTGTPVDDKDYQVPFTFTGKINKITLAIDRPKLTPEDENKLKQALLDKKAGD